MSDNRPSDCFDREFNISQSEHIQSQNKSNSPKTSYKEFTPLCDILTLGCP